MCDTSDSKVKSPIVNKQREVMTVLRRMAGVVGC